MRTRFSTTAAVLVVTLASSVVLTTPTASATAFDPARTVSSDAPVSPSGVGVNAVIGTDDRSRITPTTAYPVSAVVLLRFNGGQCTGFMIDARTVATAGWCVYSPFAGGWRTNVVAYPGADGTITPFGSCPASKLYTTAGWSQGGDSRYDFGAVRLQCEPGLFTGWLSLAPVSGIPDASCTYNLGYPADKPGTLWGGAGVVYTVDGRLAHSHDTSIGHEGGPIILGDNDLCRKPLPVPTPRAPWRVIAINSAFPVGQSLNGSVPITGYVYDTYQRWMQDSHTGG
jgi:V8-like Glu-specific endopeptidase